MAMKKKDISDMERQDFYLPPKQAIKALKQAEENYSTVYIYGITFSGKTTLVKYYLRRKNYIYLKAGDLLREDIDSLLTRKSIIVIDDLWEIKYRDELESIYKEHKKKIRELAARDDIWVILIGRATVPAWLSDLRFDTNFVCIDENKLKASIEDISRIMEQYKLKLKPEQELLVLKECMGVQLGIRIFAENASINYGCDKEIPDEQLNSLICEGRRKCWKYLDFHVYNQWDVDIQEFVMETSIVDVFTTKLAAMITGRKDVEQLMEELMELGNFIVLKNNDGETEYGYIQEMKMSLRSRLRQKYSEKRISNLYHNAGLYYELNGHISSALEMYKEIGDEEAIASTLILNGRGTAKITDFYNLKEYYFALSDEKIKESPELMSGMSIIYSMMMLPEKSEFWYDELKKYAGESKGSEQSNARGRLLLLDIALPHRGTQGIIDIIKKGEPIAKQRITLFPIMGTTMGSPSQINGAKDFCLWCITPQEKIDEGGRILHQMIGSYGRGMRNLGIAERMLEQGEDNYEILRMTNKGIMEANVSEAIEHIFVGEAILSWLHVQNGKPEEAEEILSGFRTRVVKNRDEIIMKNIDAMMTRIRLYQGKETEIMSWLEACSDEEDEFVIFDRLVYLVKARVYISMGRNEKALNLLERLKYYANMMHRTYIDIELDILIGITLYRMKNPKWKDCLRAAVDKGYVYRLIRIFTREGAGLYKPLKELEYIGEDDGKNLYYKRLVKETNEMGIQYPKYLQVDEKLQLEGNSLQVLRCIATGKTNQQIGQELGITEHTVKYHISQIYKRLNVKNRATAVAEAKRRGII